MVQTCNLQRLVLDTDKGSSWINEVAFPSWNRLPSLAELIIAFGIVYHKKPDFQTFWDPFDVIIANAISVPKTAKTERARCHESLYGCSGFPWKADAGVFLRVTSRVCHGCSKRRPSWPKTAWPSQAEVVDLENMASIRLPSNAKLSLSAGGIVCGSSVAKEGPRVFVADISTSC